MLVLLAAAAADDGDYDRAIDLLTQAGDPGSLHDHSRWKDILVVRHIHSYHDVVISMAPKDHGMEPHQSKEYDPSAKVRSPARCRPHEGCSGCFPHTNARPGGRHRDRVGWK